MIAAPFIGEEEKQLRQDMHRDIKRLETEVAGIRDDLRVLHDLLAHRAHEPDDAHDAEAKRHLR